MNKWNKSEKKMPKAGYVIEFIKDNFIIEGFWDGIFWRDLTGRLFYEEKVFEWRYKKMRI